MIPYDIDRAVGSGASDIVNCCGWIMRTTISFRDGSWKNIVLKHGEAMWYRVKDKFEVQNGRPEHKLQGFLIILCNDFLDHGKLDDMLSTQAITMIKIDRHIVRRMLSWMTGST
ncbi:hypothetical protein CQW23_34067 [Capsicum baccatum]|uniref:Uncharacterized protein n=1 Tax=Capsicum baccatum TaxID=33114 RepID=A0A2G2V0A7_CAPBA|nr:hypothetical protein CQW23_34067 [Capsicum baccatum]